MASKLSTCAGGKFDVGRVGGRVRIMLGQLLNARENLRPVLSRSLRLKFGLQPGDRISLIAQVAARRRVLVGGVDLKDLAVASGSLGPLPAVLGGARLRIAVFQVGRLQPLS